MPAKKGDRVKVEYTGTLDDGTVFDTSVDDEPLEFEVGAGEVITGFDGNVEGMEVGEEREFKLSPEDAYGERQEELEREVPREHFPKSDDFKVGVGVELTLPDGTRVRAVVSEIGDEMVSLDFNHPMSGKTLNFKVKLLEICN